MDSNKERDAIVETEHLLQSNRDLREKFENDPYRPKYHFMAPGGWMNDPTGAIYWRGRYHLFYVYYPDAAYSVVEYDDGSHEHLKHCWGHASSRDLLHWVHHPIALRPSIAGVDGDSCFSGHVFDDGGVATMTYYGRPGGSCIARCSDYELNDWLKHPAVVIPQPEQGDEDYGKYSAGDPCMWKEDDRYYALCGFRDPEGGDTASLFRSTDTFNWEYLHSLYRSNRQWTTAADDCAVPDFFQLGHRHMLLFMSHETGAQYYLGRWENETFFPETHGHMNWPGGQLNAPKSMLDAEGRRLFWGWVCEGRTREAQRAAGWASTLSLPRVLSLSEDGSLMIEPAVELQGLRHNGRKREHIHLDAGDEFDLPEMKGDCLELALELDPEDSEELGLKVRCSPDRREQTSISYYPYAKRLVIDTRKSSLREDVLQPWPRPWATLFSDPSGEREGTEHVQVQEAPFELGPRETLRLRVFLDRSVLEIFANNRQCMTQRIYPERDDSLGVTLFSTGGNAVVRSVEAWDMDAIGI